MSKLLQALEEQPIQEIVLPSFEGYVRIRPLTTSEDNLLTTTTLISVKSAQLTALKALYNCIVDFDDKLEQRPNAFEEFVLRATNADISALAFAVLTQSYNTLSIRYTCESCGHSATSTVKTDTLTIDKIEQVPDYLTQQIKPFEVKLNKVKVVLYPKPTTVGDMIQMMHYYEKIDPQFFLAPDVDTWFDKFVGVVIDLPSALKFVLKNIYKLEGIIGKEKEEYARPIADIYCQDKQTFQTLQTMHQIIDKFPITSIDEFTQYYTESIKMPEFDVKDIEVKCEKCGAQISIPFDPFLFFLLKMLKTV